MNPGNRTAELLYRQFRYSEKSSDTALVIPVYNESDRIYKQLSKLERVPNNIDIIIVDGNSTDGCLDFLELEKKTVNTLLINDGEKGLSRQLQIAFQFCIQNEYQYVITMDGNNKDEPEGLLGIQMALKEGFDFVQGSRFVSGGVAINTPFSRLIGLRFIHAPVTSAAAMHWFTDSTNGFRGHSVQLLADGNMSILRDVFRSYELLAYIPIRASRLGYSVKESPVTRAYPSAGETPTKIKGIRGNLRMLLILFRAAFGRYNP